MNLSKSNLENKCDLERFIYNYHMPDIQCGGFTQHQPVTEEIRRHLRELMPEISVQYDTTDFNPVTYATQVVAGLNYLVRVERVNGNNYFVKYFKNLEGGINLIDMFEE